MKKRVSPLQRGRAGALFVRGAHLREKDNGISAFTLLELIIALSIGTVLILLVSFSIRMGFFQMQRGSRWLEESHRENSALHFFRQQVTSMRSETVDEDVIFDGDSERIVFVTPISLKKSYGLGLMMVLYYSEKDGEGVRLNYKEKRFLPNENLSTFKDQISSMFDKSEEVEIVNGYEKISFQFLGVEESEDNDVTSSHSSLDWKDIWIVNSLPKAIKIVFLKDGENKEMIAPVMVMY
jgi:hypothetical protein